MAIKALLIAVLITACVEPGDTGLNSIPGFKSFVYECIQHSDDTVLELCWNKDKEILEAMLDAMCEGTSRHSGPCLYSCDVNHEGCNAFQGCWCPTLPK